jgi:hypothetical protein
VVLASAPGLRRTIQGHAVLGQKVDDAETCHTSMSAGVQVRGRAEVGPMIDTVGFGDSTSRATLALASVFGLQRTIRLLGSNIW